MINREAFDDAWTLLCERFNREPSRALALAYYKILSPQMDTDAFRAAANRIFRGHEFFPRPADFLEGDAEARALTAWEQTHRLMRGFATADQLDPEARRVVRLLGGERKLRNTPLDAVQYVRRDFLKLYGEAAAIAAREGRPQIEAGEEAKRLAAGVDLNVIEGDG